MTEPIAAYTFLPWLRQGISSEITRPDTLGLPSEESASSEPAERASVTISLKVKGERERVPHNVQLAGPGDVIGISPRAIIRTEPRNWVTDFEPNYLAFIEFYDEELPWRFTPAHARQVMPLQESWQKVEDPQQSKLTPWIILMVLEEGEFEPLPTLPGTLSAIRLTAADLNKLLPPPTQAWAWAHVHVSKDITDPDGTLENLQNLVRQNPDYALSRLICPRKLRPLTGYHAFLMPAFEVGRLAGLGMPTTGIDALTPSWGNGQTEYPAYYRWYFRTGERGDFEHLVNLLEPRPVDERVGIRDMDMQAPGYGVQGMTDVPVMGLEGALKSPQAQPRPSTWPPSGITDYPAFLNELEEVVNLQQTLLDEPERTADDSDPIVGPPLYGNWHALQNRLNTSRSGWVNELNQDPRYRVPAGIGTEVIQKNQETYMQRAWQQLGDVLSVNQKIRQIQLSIAASTRLFAKHFLPLSPDQRIAISRPVHSRLLDSSTNEGQVIKKTLFQKVEESKLPRASLQPAFRRILRPRGPIIRKVLPQSGGKITDILVRINEGQISAAPPKEAPEQQISLDNAADSVLPFPIPRWLRQVLFWKPLLWLLLALLIIAVPLLMWLQVPQPIILLVSVVLAGLALFMRWLRSRIQISDRFHEEALTSEAASQVPPHPGFLITEPGQAIAPGVFQGGGADSQEAVNFRSALLDLHARLEIRVPIPDPPPPLDFQSVGNQLVKGLDPKLTITNRAKGFIKIPPTFTYPRPVETIVPVMAHPVFSDPMYRSLRDISSELLIPNLSLIPNNTITLLETNQKFIEAYMVGLNHEMARELLWREYPTDQRGSYFRQFWDVGEIVNHDEGKDAQQIEEELRDIALLHEWGRNTSLGSHKNRELPSGGENRDLPAGDENAGQRKLVLVIRGDILKKYPTAVIYAQKAKWVDDTKDSSIPPRKIRELDHSNPANNMQQPIFKAEIEPDIRFIGFDLTVSAAKGDPTPPSVDGEPGNPGWFFVIQERPGEPRFGLDVTDNLPENQVGEINSWNELTWNHLGNPDEIPFININVDSIPTVNSQGPDKNIKWGSNAADMAYVLYQVPVMVAVHADNMLE